MVLPFCRTLVWMAGLLACTIFINAQSPAPSPQVMTIAAPMRDGVMRGQVDSGGDFQFMRDGKDGYDLVEWLARQLWSSGAVALFGSSYTGTNQWRIARERPPALSCNPPAAVWHHPFEVIPYGGGVFNFRWALTWPALLSDAKVERGKRPAWADLLQHRPLQTADELVYGKPLRLFCEFLAHPIFDDYWRAQILEPAEFTRIAIPALMFTGYLDEMHPGTLSSFRAMHALSPARDRQFLVVGPWEHATVVDAGLDYRDNYRPARKVRNLNLPDQAFLNSKDIYGRCFDWCLKGGPQFEQFVVRSYLTGANRWLDLPAYPPPNARTTALFLSNTGNANGLSGDGRLSWKAPRAREPGDHFVFDPLEPDGASSASQGEEPVDLRSEIDRSDVLVYVTEPLERPVTVAGNVRLVLYAATDGRDTDWAARLEDVAPDGRAIRLGVGPAALLRARYRKGFVREQLLVPNKTYSYTLDFYDLGHTFKSGHRLRLSVSSAAYPWVHPNPNTGNPIATDTAKPRKARQSIFHDRLRPSRLLLPILR